MLRIDDETVAQWRNLIARLLSTIADDDRASDDPDDDTPGMQLIIGADADGWNYQTGDNCYMGGAYGYEHWAVLYLSRDGDPAEYAEEARREIEERAAQ